MEAFTGLYRLSYIVTGVGREHLPPWWMRGSSPTMYYCVQRQKRLRIIKVVVPDKVHVAVLSKLSCGKLCYVVGILLGSYRIPVAHSIQPLDDLASMEDAAAIRDDRGAGLFIHRWAPDSGSVVIGDEGRH